MTLKNLGGKSALQRRKPENVMAVTAEGELNGTVAQSTHPVVEKNSEVHSGSWIRKAKRRRPVVAHRL